MCHYNGGMYTNTNTAMNSTYFYVTGSDAGDHGETYYWIAFG